MAAEKKQLVLVVEGTAALGPHWRIIVSDYLEKVIRKFCGNEAKEVGSSIVELALVQFNAHGSYSSCLVQRSGWARNVDYFLEWLSCMQFGGGGFCDAAIAEGLAEVLMMCPPPNGTDPRPTDVVQRHCILVAASNPYPLPTPVYRPPNKSDTQSENRLFDAETIAKSFPQSCVSLSVICPKQLPKLKAIYNAGKRNPSATVPTVDIVKNPHYLILISEDFTEACDALSPSVTTNSPSSMNIASVSPVSEPPPTSVSPVNKSLLAQQPVSVGNIPLATVKAEPCTVSPITSPQAKTYSPSPTSQERISRNDHLQDMKPVVSNIQQPLRPAGPVNVSILNNLSQARLASPTVLAGGTATGISSIGGKAIHMSNMIAGSVSAPLSGTAQVAQHVGSMMAAPGMSQQVQGMQSVGVDNNMGTNVGVSQLTSSALQAGRPKYLKIWEGELRGRRQNQIVMITKLEAYRSSSTAESLADDWPSTLLIDRLVSQDHMNSKTEYVGKCEYIVFRALNQHGFLGQMQDKKLCTVVRLPSQTLLLSVTDKPFRLIGMLFPGDKVVFKPPVPSQQLSQQQQQQRVGPRTSQGAGGPTQLVSVGQGQVSSPGPKPKQELP
ncbi:putative mediator complex, subunit Med25, von Willebrand factor type A [Helianthus annuus]|nr:putative mediator complex, subunit Med25, von Willebrand factor type A [Helianthus annuus]KAJ0636327.1 putative mediator complex, subunit Med25, von Willebrand factor type A [Helianthus annuus]